MATELEEAYVFIKGEIDELKLTLAKAKDAVKSAVGAMNAIGHVTLKVALKPFRFALRKAVALVRSAVRKMISIIKKATAVIIAVVGASVKAFASFEEQLANVSTMLNKQTMYLMPRYAKELTRLSVKFGEATQTLSDGLYAVLSASIPAEKALGVLEVAATAAQAGMTDTGTAVKAIVSILNAYGMQAEDAAKVSDILFAAVKKGQTTFAELASSIGQATAIAASAGVPFEEVAAALATITRGGISTAEAVTALRMAMMALQGKNQKGVKIAKQHGVELSVTALKANGLTGMLKKLSGLSDTVIAQTFSEVRARVALNVLIKNQTGYLEDFNTTMNATGMTQEAYDKQVNLLTKSFKRLWQAVKANAIILGSAFGKQVKASNDALRDWLVEQQPLVEEWSNKFAASVGHVKDALVDFAKYAATDFQGAIAEAMHKVLDSITGVAEALIPIFKKIAADFMVVMGLELNKFLQTMHEESGVIGKSMAKLMNVSAKAMYKHGKKNEVSWSDALKPAMKKISGMGKFAEYAQMTPRQKLESTVGRYKSLRESTAGTVGERQKELQNILIELRRLNVTNQQVWREMVRQDAIGSIK